MTNKFTEKAGQILTEAKKIAQKMGHSYIGTEHLLLGVVLTDCVGAKLIDDKKISYADIYDQVCITTGKGNGNAFSTREMTPKCKKVLENASSVAKKFGGKFIGSEHILYGICEENDSVGARILTTLGANLPSLKNEICQYLDVSSDSAQNERIGIVGCPVLSQFGKNLNRMARENRIDPVIGRKAEVGRLIQVLSRRSKNNPCLIGEPGVGKTAIVEGLASAIVGGEVPENLSGKIIVSLELSAMVAGAKYRGEFEERMRNVLSELKNNRNIILFIDEIHTIVGAGSAEGAVDGANILKPSLSRSEIQCIGATTTAEYRKYIEKDSALERRFQPIMVEEPTKEKTVEILKGLKSRYESHHGVKISEEGIESAVELSARYLPERSLPDKAIDLLDESCAKAKLRESEQDSPVKKAERELKLRQTEKEEAILRQDFEEAMKIKEEETRIKASLEKIKKESKSHRIVIGEREIKETVTEWTKIPIDEINRKEKERLLNLEKELSSVIIGQEEAVKKVSECIRRGRLGLKNPSRPSGSFLFLGTTGTGKSELAKQLAKRMFGSPERICKFDMSEYAEKYSISKLIGSAPGYVGYEEGGTLTEAVHRQPYCVILFDEIEKAHPDIYNVLLQILEDGTLTDSQGRKTDFRNTIIILTSNVGAESLTETKNIGFSQGLSKESEYEQIKQKIGNALKKTFSPEFLNRLDDIVVFNPLTQEDMKRIANLMLIQVRDLARKIGVTLSWDEELLSYLAKHGYDKEYGARPLRRLIVSEIENPLSDRLVKEEITPPCALHCTVEADRVAFT